MNNPSSKNDSTSTFRTGYSFALFALFSLGVALIIIGAGLFPPNSLGNQAFIGIGISLGPAAIVAALFRIFLFREVQHQLTYPLIEEVKEAFVPEVRDQFSKILEQYKEEISALRALKEAGIVRPYRRRKMALRDFARAIEAESSEIVVVGSSLLGLLQDPEYLETRELLKRRAGERQVRIKFLLTHPVVADLRANQETRESTAIGTEIIESLKILKAWELPPENVRLYKGTPTCFGIKTSRLMLLNPYPYGAVAYASPCLIVEAGEGGAGYFYDEFDKSHFREWGTAVAEEVRDYDETIERLSRSLRVYAQAIGQLFARASTGDGGAAQPRPTDA